MRFSRCTLILALFVAVLVCSPSLYSKANQRVHPVRSGETLWSISRLYDIPVKKIARANHLTNPARLEVGQKLTIPLNVPPIKSKASWNFKYGNSSLNKLLAIQTRKMAKWKYIVIHHSATPNGGGSCL